MFKKARIEKTETQENWEKLNNKYNVRHVQKLSGYNTIFSINQ